MENLNLLKIVEKLNKKKINLNNKRTVKFSVKCKIIYLNHDF